MHMFASYTVGLEDFTSALGIVLSIGSDLYLFLYCFLSPFLVKMYTEIQLLLPMTYGLGVNSYVDLCGQ